MQDTISINQTAEKIRAIYLSDHEHADERIEAFLTAELDRLPSAQKIAFMEKLLYFLNKDPDGPAGTDYTKAEVVARLFSLVLGKKVSKEELTSNELLQNLAQSLNTIFNALNQLIGLINKTFLGQSFGNQTIRQVIGFQLENRAESQSLESYLAQIKKAFLAVQQAFIKTAQKMIEELLNELDPVQFNNQNKERHLLKSSRKAEAYSLYEEQFSKCRKWFESERFQRDFLREFEKNCQKITLDGVVTDEK